MSQKLDNRPGEVYDESGNVPDDDALRRITGISPDEEADIDRRAAEGQDDDSGDNSGLSSEQLGAAENAGGSSDKAKSSAGAHEKDKLYNPGDKGGKPGLKTRRQSSKNARKFLLGGGAAGGLLGLIFMVIAFIAPFKVTAIINSIEDRVGKIPQNAVDHRLEFYMSQFLMLQAAKNAGVDWEKDRNYVYIGNGVFSTLYTNWKGAKLDAKIQTDYGLKLTPNKPKGELLGRRLTDPSNWTVTYTNQIDRETGKPRTETLRGAGAREFVREFARSETKSHQVFKRYTMRKTLKRYHGIHNWKPFEEKRENARDSYIEKKKNFKMFMIRQTVAPMAPKRAAYMNCLLNGDEDCKQSKLAPADQPPSTDSETENAINDESNNDGSTDADGDKKTFGKVLQKSVLKKILAGSFAGIGFLEVIKNIDDAVGSGAVSQITYNNLSGQYVGFSAAVESGADQVRSGDLTSGEEARIMAEMFDGYESSPVNLAKVNANGTVSAASDNVSRDCDGDGDYEELKPGELVCPERKVMQNKDGIKSMPFWPVLHGVAQAYKNTVGGFIGGVIGVVSGALSAALEATGVNAGISYLLEKSGVSGVALKAVESGINYIIGFAITGEEEGQDAYDAVYAGKSVQQSTVGSTLDVSAREDTTAGQYLTNEQVQAIRKQQFSDKQFALSRQPFFKRYFSPDNPDSITTYAIMHTPTSVASFANSIVNAPTTMLRNFSTVMLGKTSAAGFNTNADNPFAVLRFGYPNDHEALTMNEQDLRQKYRCDLEPKDRPQNQDNPQNMGRPDGVPFNIPTSVDPCSLEKVVEKSGSGLFAGGFNDLNQ